MQIWFLVFVCSVYAFNAEQKLFFEENGYLGPLPLLSVLEAETICEEVNFVQKFLPLGPRFWSKNILFNVPAIVALAQREEFLVFLQPLLGPHILLWGAELIKKPPKAHHRWHVDIEHTGWEGVTIWLALRNTSLQSTISFIPGSHRYDFIPQTLEDRVDLHNNEEILQAALFKYPNSKIVSMDIKPGEFVIFSGKIWHNSVNHSCFTREAFIFQYCRPDAHVRIPLNYRIPTLWSNERPWVLKILGEDFYGVNFLYQH